MEFCSYVHAKPNGDVFYVGKGTAARAKLVQNRPHNLWHRNIVNKYGANNILVGVIECSSEQSSFDLEIGLIKCFRRMGAALVNLTDGGQGPKGRKRSEEAKAKTSAKLKGIPRPDHVRAAISKANTGKKVSDKTKQKLSVIFKNRPLHKRFLEKQKGRFGILNPHAKSVIGFHPDFGDVYFLTMTEAAKSINGSVAKISRAIKTGYLHKGWAFSFKERA